jgi:hypothetical protein
MDARVRRAVHATPDYASHLQRGLRGLTRRFAKNELAVLAFSSKVELAVRDRLAYALSRRLPRSLVVRERRRADLAVLSDEATPKPLMLLEATAMYSFDLIEQKPGRSVSPEKVQRDVTKLRATRDLPRDAQLFVLIVASHPKRVPDRGTGAREAMKYARQIVRTLSARSADELAAQASRNVSSRLGYLGQVRSGVIKGGEAYGVPIEIHHWLIGPISQRGGHPSSPRSWVPS